MRGLTSRVRRLEATWNVSQEPPRVFRVVVSNVAKQIDWSTSTCTRRMGVNGSLLELVMLDGNCRELPDAELDQFVERFPIQPGGR